jgi:hypothetical protein
VEVDWGQVLDDMLPGEVGQVDPDEARARSEKVAALAELAAARFSVLIGPAGTGKTTLLAALCAVPQIFDRGVLLLAPTGKARVQLSKRLPGSSVRARTIAEFLVRSGRYDPETGAYRRSDEPPNSEYATVIVDEASMVTEEQLDAVLDAVRDVQRLILVGDPRQLPPIGAGRPFVDIVSHLGGSGRVTPSSRSDGVSAWEAGRAMTWRWRSGLAGTRRARSQTKCGPVSSREASPRTFVSSGGTTIKMCSMCC